jgi:hypothetical protein
LTTKRNTALFSKYSVSRKLSFIQPFKLKLTRRGRRIQTKPSRSVLNILRKSKGAPTLRKLKNATRKRLTSEEFLRIQEKLWKEGPKVKYPNPDSWTKPDPENLQ